MPCCSVSRSRISFCLPCHVRDRPVYLVYFYRDPPVPTRTAARAPPPAPGTRADRDRRGAPPPGIPPGSAHRPLAPRLRRARAPSPGQTPAPGWRGLKAGETRRVAHTHTARPRIRSKARRRCARCVRRRARRHRSPRTRPRMPRRPHRRHATGPRPDCDFRPVSETHVGDNAHTDTAHASVHTPHPTRADRAAHLRCTTARRIDTHSIDTQHSALNVSAATGAHDNHLAVLARFNRPTACSTHRHRIGASGHNAHLGHSLCSHGSRLERWWLFSPLSSPTHGSD